MNPLYTHEVGREASFQHADVTTRSFPHAQTPLHFWMPTRQTADCRVRRPQRCFYSCGTTSSPAPSFAAAQTSSPPPAFGGWLGPLRPLWGWFVVMALMPQELQQALCHQGCWAHRQRWGAGPRLALRLGQDRLWGCAARHTTRTWAWVTGLGSRRGRVRDNLGFCICGKRINVCKIPSRSLNLFVRISQRFSSECIQSPAGLYSW